MAEISKTLGDQFKDSGVRVAYIKQDYNNNAFDSVRAIGTKSRRRTGGLPYQDYFTAAVSGGVSARVPQRIKTGETTLNGVEMG